jgi:coproporphyrinogen III oxidase
MNPNQELASKWFKNLRDKFCDMFEEIELQYALRHKLEPAKFVRKNWDRQGGGGGEMSVMKGNVFEKVGVNISTVYGALNDFFRKEIPGAAETSEFFATGVSLVAHMKSPLIPAAHFNTRYITTTKAWFGGGGDLTPTYPEDEETKLFHDSFKNACDQYDASYYENFKRQCDEYFFLKHRNEPRGVGGIFFDYLNTDNFNNDFDFVKSVGLAFLDSYSQIVKRKLYAEWSEEQKEYQLLKRGRYVEFNLLYDRGTRFGLMTEGNVEAIFMSLPPEVKWL